MLDIVYEDYTVTMPDKLNHAGARYLASQCIALPVARVYRFDFSKVIRAFPFGILVISRMLKNIKKELLRKCEAKSIAPIFNVVGHEKDSPVLGYLRHIGFFQSFGCNLGRCVGEALGSDRYVPITCISFSEILRGQSGIHYGNVIQGEAERLAKILSECGASSPVSSTDCQDATSYSFLALSYLMREIIRNAHEHSMAEDVFICGQYFKNLHIAEIAILDEGIGILESLKFSHNIVDKNKALEFSVQPGVSGVSISHESSSDEWANTGFGLYVSSQVCTLDDDSQFCIASNNHAFVMGKTTKNSFRLPFFNGTAVMLKLKFYDDVYFENQLERIVQEGEKIARTHNRIYPASSASKRVSLRSSLIPPPQSPRRNPPDGGDGAS